MSLLPPDQALQVLAQRVAPLPPVQRPLGKATGLFLAEEVVAREHFPKVSVAAMDGYALRQRDGGKWLPVAYTVAAGEYPPPLPPHSCARILTGAPVPAGADTVVEQELVPQREGNRVFIPALEDEGRHIRKQGEIFAAGEVVAQRGERLTPPTVGLLAAAGVGKVWVYPLPQVGAVVTGSEVGRRGRAGVRDSNGPLLAALCQNLGLPLLRPVVVEDREEALHRALGAALAQAHLVLTTGGVSVGDWDLVPQVVKALGGEVLFHGVAMQPGKPIFAALCRGKLLLGLPGNPLSALVGFRLFAFPCVRGLSGDPTAFSEPWWSLPLVHPVENRGKRTQFRPAQIHCQQGEVLVEVVPWKGSHDLKAAAHAQALVRLEPGSTYPAGSPVPTLPLFSPRF